MSADNGWWVPTTVLNALWGTLMPRLAASVWSGRLVFDHAVKDIYPGLPGFLLEGPALTKVRARLIEMAFTREKWYNDLQPVLDKSGVTDQGARLSELQRMTHLVLKYLGDEEAVCGRVPIRFLYADAYDFVLSNKGVDAFIPQNPFKNGDLKDPEGRIKVLQLYKFRETGKPPIGLPGAPASFPANQGDVLIPLPQLSSPTGAYQVHQSWVKANAATTDWWITGTAYRSMMSALPRVIANLWYEEAAWPDSAVDPNGNPNLHTTTARFEDRLKELLAERMETGLSEQMVVEVVSKETLPDADPCLEGWDLDKDRDIRITNRGFYVPHPGPAPDGEALVAAIEEGRAGNPVFTDSPPCIT